MRPDGALDAAAGAVEYHLGWLDLHGRPTESDGGKSVRAGLAYYAGPPPPAPTSRSASPAVAIELVRNWRSRRPHG